MKQLVACAVLAAVTASADAQQRFRSNCQNRLCVVKLSFDGSDRMTISNQPVVLDPMGADELFVVWRIVTPGYTFQNDGVDVQHGKFKRVGKEGNDAFRVRVRNDEKVHGAKYCIRVMKGSQKLSYDPTIVNQFGNFPADPGASESPPSPAIAPGNC